MRASQYIVIKEGKSLLIFWIHSLEADLEWKWIRPMSPMGSCICHWENCCHSQIKTKNNSYVNGVTKNSCCVWVGIHNLNVRVRVWIFILFFFHSFGAVFCLFQFNPTRVGGHSGHKFAWNQKNYSSKNRTAGIWKSSPKNRRSLFIFAFQLLAFRNIPNTAPSLTVDTINGHHQQQTGFISFQIPTEKNRNSNCYFPYESGATHQKSGPTIKLFEGTMLRNNHCFMLVVARFPMICVVF